MDSNFLHAFYDRLISRMRSSFPLPLMMIFEDEVSCYERMDDRERAGFIPRSVTLYFSFRPGDVSSGEDVFIEVIIENSHEIISREPSTRNVMRMIDACVSRVYYSNLTDEIICKSCLS
jgi:hypothetical protein